MFNNIEVGKVEVLTSNGPLGVDHFARRLSEKIITVAGTAPLPIREQALAFKENIYLLARHYIQEAINSDRANMNMLG